MARDRLFVNLLKRLCFLALLNCLPESFHFGYVLIGPTKNVVKVALASPADLKKFNGGKAAWRRQWDFTSDDFGMTAWMDFPDISYGDAFLYVNTNTFTRTYDSAGKQQNAFAKLIQLA